MLFLSLSLSFSLSLSLSPSLSLSLPPGRFSTARQNRKVRLAMEKEEVAAGPNYRVARLAGIPSQQGRGKKWKADKFFLWSLLFFSSWLGIFFLSNASWQPWIPIHSGLSTPGKERGGRRGFEKGRSTFFQLVFSCSFGNYIVTTRPTCAVQPIGMLFFTVKTSTCNALVGKGIFGQEKMGTRTPPKGSTKRMAIYLVVALIFMQHLKNMHKKCS